MINNLTIAASQDPICCTRPALMISVEKIAVKEEEEEEEEGNDKVVCVMRLK